LLYVLCQAPEIINAPVWDKLLRHETAALRCSWECGRTACSRAQAHSLRSGPFALGRYAYLQRPRVLLSGIAQRTPRYPQHSILNTPVQNTMPPQHSHPLMLCAECSCASAFAIASTYPHQPAGSCSVPPNPIQIPQLSPRLPHCLDNLPYPPPTYH
jgi:hypothetical protein